MVACFNGHAHWNTYHCVDGVHYITLPSLTESFTNYPEPCEAWSFIDIGEESFTVQVFGRLPITYVLPLRDRRGHHWVNLDKSYSPSLIKPA